MAYFVTGATGFIGRHLVQELVDNRQGEIFVLVREGSRDRSTRWCGSGAPTGSRRSIGDLRPSRLGVSHQWVTAHSGEIEHFFHLAAIYDMTATDEMNETLNVGGTRNALELAAELDAGSSTRSPRSRRPATTAASSTRPMFDEGQRLPSPYHRTKFESEKIVREEATVPWRVYRPAIVVGHSETGAMDKIDGPYYFFPLLKRMRDTLPGWVPLVGVDLGDTNVVPVDYVAKAMDHLAHQPGLDGQAFHLVNPEPQNTVGLINAFAAAAKAPQFAVPVDRNVTGLLPTRAAPPRRCSPTTLLGRCAADWRRCTWR